MAPSPTPRRAGSRSWRRRIATAAIVLSLAAVTVAVDPVQIEEAAAASSKITICHRTHSTTNPYRRITVSQNAVTNARHGGHKVPSGSTNPAVFDPSFTYAPNNKFWGDIIPGASDGGTAYNGSNAIALNWTAEGIAAFQTWCAPMTAKQFYDVEIAAGQDPQSVIDDLNEQAANEDAALLASLGGSFSLGNVESWDTAVSVTSSAATSVGTTTATLNGAITVGAITTAVGFDYGTSSTLATFTSVSAGSDVSSVSGHAITTGLTGLTAGTTYYFRATGTTNAGADTEGVLSGAILSFTTTGSAAQSITFDQPADMALGGATQTLTSATADTSGLAVTFTSTTPSVCTVAGAVVTAVDSGTCSITATQPGDTTYAPATPVTRSLTVTATARTLVIDAASYGASYAADATPPTITATASAGDADGTKSYSSTTTGVCAVAAATGVVTFVQPGSCTIGAAITAGGAYASATASTVTFTVTAISRTLTIDTASYQADGYAVDAAAPTITSTASAGAGTKTYSSSTTSVCTVDAGTGAVTFVDDGTCTIGATIAADGGHAAATATSVSFPIAAVVPPPTTTTTTVPPTTTTTAPPPPPPPSTTTTTAPPPTTTTTAPSPTTTVPPTSTTSPPEVPTAWVDPAPDGALEGVVWFDRNRNGVFDEREWLLPGVEVTLQQVVFGAAATTDDGVTPTGPVASRRAVTDAAGRYAFEQLPPGEYAVEAVATIAGFDYTSDTDGGFDWQVAAGVRADEVAVASFAGLGKGQIVGQMFEERTGDGLAHATIRCLWGGYDDVLGSADDVPFELTADGDGRFDMVGVPYGSFTCGGTDAQGRTSRTVGATVFSAEPQEAQLPVGSDLPTLPKTGGASAPLATLAVACLVLGALLVAGSGRRRPGGGPTER